MLTWEELCRHFKELWTAPRTPSGFSHTKNLWDEGAKDWKSELSQEGKMAFLTDRRIQEAIRFLSGKGLLGPECDVIDIGCGPGRFVGAFARTAHWVTGTDLSTVMTGLGADYCAENGIENVSFVPCDFKTADPEELGWSKRFDLVFSSMTPALGPYESFGKIMDMSRGYCCNAACIQSRSTLEQEVALALTDKTLKPAWDGRLFYALLNLVWLAGYFPETDYYEVTYTEQLPLDRPTLEKTLETLYRGSLSEKADLDRVYDRLMGQARDGVFENQCTYRYGTILWSVLARDERRRAASEGILF